ncbi:MAG: MFS transporter [Ktedonobacterales bacterium]
METGPAARVRHLAPAIFINRNFALLWWGQAISSVGDYAWDTALVLWIATFLAKGRAWAPLAVSGVLLAAAVPQIVVGPVAGVFVDRMDRRLTMVVATFLQAIFALLLLLIFGSSWLPFVGQVHLAIIWQLAIVYADVAILTICAQFFLPAQLALIKDIVPREKQDQAIETSQAITGLAIIIGPPLAAALVFSLGVSWALWLNALSFMVSLATTIAIKTPESASSLAAGENSHFSREFLDGFGYVLNHSILRTILISEVLTWLGLGALQTLGYFFITQNLKASPSAYGLLGADFGLGAIMGALLVTILGERIGLARILWSGLILSGLFVTLLSHLTSLVLALVAAFFFGLTATAIIVSSGALALRSTSREFVGRVTAVINPLGKLAALISIGVAGYLVSSVLQGFHADILSITFGPVNTVFTGMGLLAVAGGIYARIHLRAA